MGGHDTTAKERAQIYLGLRKAPPDRRTRAQIIRAGVLAALFWGVAMYLFFGLVDGFTVARALATVVGTVVFGVVFTAISLSRRVG